MAMVCHSCFCLHSLFGWPRDNICFWDILNGVGFRDNDLKSHTIILMVCVDHDLVVMIDVSVVPCSSAC